MTPTIGSLFSGMGALDLAVREVFSAETAWFVEWEPPTKGTPRPRNAGAKVLAHRFPDVPNHGDVTEVDWTTVRPVTITAAGYPCQSQSAAGLQLGQDDERWLWPVYRKAIGALRPMLAIGENVDNHVRMDLRQVVADLHADGYTVVWVTIAASDVGACHRRRRVFWLAWPEEYGPPVLPTFPFAHLKDGRWGADDLLGWSEVGDWPYQGAAYQGAAYQGAAYQGAAQPSGLLPTPTASNPNEAEDLESWEARRQRNLDKGINGNGQGTPLGVAVRMLLPTVRVSDTNGVGSHGDGGLDLRTAVAELLPTPTVADSDRTSLTYSRGNPTLAGALLPTVTVTDANGGRNATAGRRNPNSAHHSGTTLNDAVWRPDRWGQYAEAIARHEAVFGRPAPSPTGPHGRNGEQRLDGRFTEWMMALPDGWVTDVPGISNKDAIKLCGNGVVHTQASAAFRHLLTLAPELPLTLRDRGVA